ALAQLPRCSPKDALKHVNESQKMESISHVRLLHSVLIAGYMNSSDMDFSNATAWLILRFHWVASASKPSLKLRSYSPRWTTGWIGSVVPQRERPPRHAPVEHCDNWSRAS